MKQGRETDVAKIIFLASLAILLAGAVFGLGFYSAVSQNFVYRFAKDVRENLDLVLAETDNLASGEPVHFLQPARQPGSGVTINERADDDALIMLSGFFEGSNEIRLIRRDGTVVARWPLSFSRHFPDKSYLEQPPSTDRNVDIHGALVNPDGSIVFNYEYAGAVKLSRCGDVLWTLKHPAHHSIEPAEGGGYWVLGRKLLYEGDPDGFLPFMNLGTEKPYYEDLILKIDEQGQIVENVSIPRLLYDSGLEPVLTATGDNFWKGGPWTREILHVNKVGELPSDLADAFPGFEAGDLILSMREYNMVAVVGRTDWRVKWHRTGPWRRQHDPEFNADGTITVFNNNTYRIDLLENDRSDPSKPRVSNIIRVNPATGELAVVYGQREGQEFFSVIRGKHEVMPDGGFLITEFEAGRVFEVNSNGRTVWEYINRYDEDMVLEMTEARRYPSAYFTVDDWTCPAPD